MPEQGFDVVSLDEMAGNEIDGRVRLDIRHHFGIRAFGTSAVRSIDGGVVIREHDEMGFRIGQSGQEELYVVVAGRATFTVDGEQVDAPSGTVVFVREPAATRSAVAEEPGTTVLAVGGRPGEAFLPLPPEATEAFQAFNRGDYEKSIALYEMLLAEHWLGTPPCSSTSPAPRPCSAEQMPRSSVWKPRCRPMNALATLPERTRTSIRCAMIRALPS